MTYDDFLHRLITLGIEAAKESYAVDKKATVDDHASYTVNPTDPTEHNADKLAGSIDGFMECRGLQPAQIGELLVEARKKVHEAFIRVSEKEISDGEYWRIRCREAEIEWVANCVSAMLLNQGLEPIIHPTMRGALMVARIVGVKES